MAKKQKTHCEMWADRWGIKLNIDDDYKKDNDDDKKDNADDKKDNDCDDKNDNGGDDKKDAKAKLIAKPKARWY